jgi:hypothetical protein
MTASLFATDFPLTGSTSMSLIVTGSGESFFTSSCLQSGAIFLDSWKVSPHLFYDVTASISHRPENTCIGSYIGLGYTVNSYDQSTGIWYHTNEYGVPDTTGTYPSASLVGASTAVKTNVVSGDCRFNAIQFSGSMQLTTSTQYGAVYLAIVTGSFSLSGANAGSPFGAGWSLSVAHEGVGSINAVGYQINNATTKNTLVGMSVGGYFPSAQKTAINVYASGSFIAGNPPTVNGAPWNFGSTLQLDGVGIIRAFSYGEVGSSELQSQYNCIYDTTPSK